jgi:hypothetical protein
MHTIVGFIQFLLMLTQSRLMPDLHGLFEASTVAEKTIPIQEGFRSGAIDSRDIYFFTFFSEEKVKISPRLSYAIPEGLFYETKQFKKAPPVFCPKKRYLVFCQLKTDG